MPRNVSYEVFTFDELSPAAQKVALDNTREDPAYLNYEWWDFDYEEWTERLSELGYTETEIMFTGFWSQGDGASFTGHINVPVVARRLGFEDIADSFENELDFAANVVRDNSNYVHENTVSVEMDTWRVEGVSEDRLNEFEKAVTEDVRELSRQIYSDLESTYDGLMADAMVEDAIISNGWEFYADGQPHD